MVRTILDASDSIPPNNVGARGKVPPNSVGISPFAGLLAPLAIDFSIGYNMQMNPQQAKRRASISHMYEKGATLQQVGDKFGISRERVRQVVKDAGTNRGAGGTSQMKRERVIAAIDIDQVLVLYRSGLNVRKIAKRMRKPINCIQTVLDKHSDPLDKRRRQSISGRGNAQTFTDEEAIAAIQEAARMNGSSSLGYVRYDRLAVEHGWPRAQIVMIRFGTWGEAVTAAGLTPNKSVSWLGKRSYTDADIQTALHRVATQVGHPPTYDEYRTHAGAKEPSCGTIRRRFRNSWMIVIETFFPSQPA